MKNYLNKKTLKIKKISWSTFIIFSTSSSVSIQASIIAGLGNKYLKCGNKFYNLTWYKNNTKCPTIIILQSIRESRFIHKKNKKYTLEVFFLNFLLILCPPIWRISVTILQIKRSAVQNEWVIFKNNSFFFENEAIGFENDWKTKKRSFNDPFQRRLTTLSAAKLS